MRYGYKIILLVTFFAMYGCASSGVKPWDKETLAKENMSLVVNPSLKSFKDHIYFSKEGTKGGSGVAGGGCGCN